MKSFCCILLLVASTAFAGWFRIADWDSYPGARAKGECMIYAKAVCNDLQSRKIVCHEVRYRWVKGEQKGNHAVVLFRYSGEWFIVENERTEPVKGTRYVTATGDWSEAGMLKAIKFVDRNATEIYLVN